VRSAATAEKRVSERKSYKEKLRFDVEFKNSSKVKKMKWVTFNKR
jgi:hypothetical protein